MRQFGFGERRETPVLEDTAGYLNEPSPPAYMMEQSAGARGGRNGDAAYAQFDPDRANGYQPVGYAPHGQLGYSESVVATQPAMQPTRPAQIRVINKDMTTQFRGRSQSNGQAKIRWFENRKAQLLGFCLTLAFLGMTIALYQQTWIGIAAGSANTLICSSAVIITYFRKKEWHQHPNPILHNRAVLAVFFAACLLASTLVNENKCQQLAGVTEFFFFTSEAWGLMMACDLFFSLTSPFTSYKRLMRFYHMWVWMGGIVMASIAMFTEGGGFFSVDGQVVVVAKSKTTGVCSVVERKNLVGFCLAQSRRCCENKENCCTGIVACKDNKSDFYHTQTWPWILIYGFVLVVLLVAVCVLTLAWRRLYSRGVPKTYNIRLRVLNYVSMFTGMYVFYWLLMLLAYMSAYFISNADKSSDLAIVMRQLVAFLISSKGYLDYVIWFAVNSIEKRPNGANGADMNMDLSPQCNTALRSEILYYTTSGIKDSVAADRDRYVSIPLCGDTDKKKGIKLWTFNPQSFRRIRMTYGISDADYVTMFGATTKERFSEGRSGAFMFYTGDERLIVKTMSPEECSFLRKIAANYERYMTSNQNSLLTRFYGCHSVSLYGKMYYFVVMANLFADTQVVHHRYDIKGSWVDRNAKVPKPGDKTTCRYCNASYTFGSTRNQECGDGLNFHEPNIVLKDNDLLTKVRIDPAQAHKIYDQLHKDSDFLCEQGIMDYSLLMGVQSSEYFVDTSDVVRNATSGKNSHDETLFMQVATSVSGPALYHFGVIDVLQQWTMEKKMERFYKVHVKRKDPDGVSAMPPKPYKFRFQQKMSRIFGLGNRSNMPEFHLAHPALLDVLDQQDMMQRPGTFTTTQRPGGFTSLDQDGYMLT